MLYEKDLLDKWTEYAVLKSAEEKGIKKAKTEYIRNLITNLHFTDAQIADVTELSIDFVKKIRSALKKK